MPARVSRSTRPSPASRSLRTQHFLSILDLTPGELADREIAASGRAAQMFEITIEHVSGKEVQEK